MKIEPNKVFKKLGLAYAIIGAMCVAPHVYAIPYVYSNDFRAEKSLALTDSLGNWEWDGVSSACSPEEAGNTGEYLSSIQQRFSAQNATSIELSAKSLLHPDANTLDIALPEAQISVAFTYANLTTTNISLVCSSEYCYIYSDIYNLGGGNFDIGNPIDWSTSHEMSLRLTSSEDGGSNASVFFDGNPIGEQPVDLPMNELFSEVTKAQVNYLGAYKQVIDDELYLVGDSCLDKFSVKVQ